MKQKLMDTIVPIVPIVLSILLLALLAALSFAMGRSYRVGYSRALNDIADCTLAHAHKGLCTIPCSTDSDCVEKNGER